MPERSVYTRLFGGIGNQLFQYSAGRALADRLGCDLVIDTRYLAGLENRNDCFVHFQNARFLRDRPLPPAKSDGMLLYGLWRLLSHRPKLLLNRYPRLYRENGLAFDPGQRFRPPGTYLHGYWQSDRYFLNITDELHQDLTFTTPLDGANADMAARITETPGAVSLHLRRGDYLKSGAYAACTPEYYRAALEYISVNTNGPLTCFVFSNDPAWARDNLDLGYKTVIVDINDEASGHFDLHLQSLCNHNVIANSTFSWWGAWLNTNPDRIVAAPRKWFGPDHPPNPDILPDAWARF
ncbi:Glycosyl transferase family 11 [Roseovarius litorisediminis]|uniref:Glycosyl transferase family 11 n=1 Tax=Roseovarius litorisediminis TaxID=1312363 RepID=A0A1Y5RZS7_9RHOB|nr:alpha-1,2-fucosyltransferase [Roseovarius litorisediminis]SLN29479.1 Glycosyl transferase family 11 [Roseovarius litorisediminis]